MEKSYNHVSSFNDLQQFGINFLTGEACAYAMRVLCDVNEDGKKLLAEYFGMPDIQLARNMNSTVNGKPSIGSVMLPRGILKELAQFAFFSVGAKAVALAPHSVIGVFSDEHYEGYRKMSQSIENSEFSFRPNIALTSQHPMVGSRNVHAATGRAV